MSAVVTGPFAHAPASGLAGDEGVVEPDGVGSNGGESGRPPFDPAFVADDAFFVVADDAVFSISAGASERDEGASERDGGASARLGDAETSLATSDDHDPFAPTALVRSVGTALAVVSAAGGDAPSFSFASVSVSFFASVSVSFFASVSVSFASSFSFSGARLMTSKAAAPLGPHEGGVAAATFAAGARPASALSPVSAALAATATDGGGPGGSGGAAPGGRGCGAAPASISRDLDVLPRLARPESEFRPDPEDRPVGAPGGGGGAFGSTRARGLDRNAFAAPARGDPLAECDPPHDSARTCPRPTRPPPRA